MNGLPALGHARRHRGTRDRVGALFFVGGVMLVLLAGGSHGGCRSAPSGEDPDTLVVALESAPSNLDPRLGSDQASERLFDLYLRGLLVKRPDGSLAPDLAREWTVLEEGRRYRFSLDPTARFHDGSPVTAADVAWTFNSLVDGTVPSPKRGSFAPLERVEVVDVTTVDFVLIEPWGSLLVNLTSGHGIVPAGVSPEQTNRHPIGAGPFRVVEHDGEHVVLMAREDVDRPPDAVRRVVLRAVPDATVRALELEKGSVHLVVNGLPPDTVELFRRRPAFRVDATPGSNYAYLGLNLEDPTLADPRVRRAIALAIDRPRIVDTLWRGLAQVTETLVPPGHWARHDALEPIPHDPAAARGLLDRAGWADPPGPTPRLRLTYKTSTDETALLQAQIVQAMLAEVGIEIEIRSYEFATFFGDVRRGDFQLYSLVWTGIADPDIYRYVLHSRSVPPAGANRNRYRNPAFDRLVDRAGALFDADRRRPLYLEAQEILHRDLPYVSLYTKHTVAVMPDALVGYENYAAAELLSLPRVRWRR